MNAPAQDIALQASVDMKQANANGVAYGLGLTFTHPEFTLRLDGDMKIHKTDAIVIKAPDAAVSLESLLGNFGGLMGGSGADAALSQ